MPLERRGEVHGGGAGRADAEVQRAHPAGEQPRLERPEDGALVVADGADPRPELVLAGRHERAGDHVAVAVQVLGRGVHDDVGAEFQRPGQQGRRHRAVDREPGTGAAGQLGERRDVAHLPRRVRRRFQPQQPGAAGAECRADRVDVRRIDRLYAEAPARGRFQQPVAQAPVQHPRHEDVVARVQGLEDRRGRGHARGEEERLGPALQRGQHRLGRRVGRVLVAGVAEAAAVGVVGVADEGGAGLDRVDDPARRLVDAATGLGQQGVGTVRRHG
jgi:hypothetical protein